jgi:release factor glutamine methyltransferase
MQLKDALQAAVLQLEEAGIGSSRRNAELLMMFVLGCDRAYLYAHPERELTSGEHGRYEAAIAERSRGVPAQYITGHQEFWGLDFLVSPAVLIPRPETEHVIEAVLELWRAYGVSGSGRPRLLDVGTGSGCIALALAHELPSAEIHAADISAEALEVARANAARLRLDSKVSFHHADLIAGSGLRDLDLVVSNPPYVGEEDADKVQREVRRFEPHLAVFGGREGLDIYRRLLPQAREALRPGGWLVMEIGYTQQPAISELLESWAEVAFRPDLQGIPRVVIARKMATSPSDPDPRPES